MRIIDADELKKMFPDKGEGAWTYNITAKAYIDAQPTIDQWHYPDNGEYPAKPNICIRYIDRSGDEFIGYTEWYYPSEDEVGYGRCIIDVVCNGVPVDPNDIEMWCELPYPPKEEA